MPDPVFEAGRHALAFTRGVTEKLIADLDETQLVFMPHGQANNAIWNIGHIAHTDAYFLMKLGGPKSEIIEAWKGHFGGGSVCSPNAKDYPPIAKVREEFHKQRQAVLDFFGQRSPAQLAQPMPEGLEFFAPTQGQFMAVLA